MKMMIMGRMLLCLLCFVALVYGQASPDMSIMIALRDSLKSENLNWSDPNPCLWTGLGCNTISQQVTRIQIGNRGISGALTSDLRYLSSLTVFDVMGNNLTGKIPSLAGLKSLEKLFVNDNGFTLIDSEDFFTGLSSLQFVNLDNNPLRPWAIPSSLTDATSLAVFSASNCSLFGTIPDFHWRLRFPNLTALALSGNSLEGELPRRFAGSSVQILTLNSQKLSGSISVLTQMPALTNVSLQENRFSGTIPDFSPLMTSLKLFNVSGNRLTGIVPSSFTGLTSLSHVDLSNNLLQGPTPSFKAKGITLGLNSFCLDVPAAPCDPRVNALLSIVGEFGYPVIFSESWKGNDPCNSSNMWVGITCTGANITVINFEDMGLTGIISESFGRLKALKVEGRYPNFKPNVVDSSGDPDVGNHVPRPAPGSLGSSSRKNAGKIVASVIGGHFIRTAYMG
ncbi:hypothetical protein AALP_AA8G458100 [Arabis alpina]|uniref:Leucine-rich repeat-containing N-terminal plant-type domain-containing protein n=1 Tax=Arabis alpina TaxID=50452 RepID=A0A087GDP4_ARAAL|nr:hypothetical protein AALP_AA8G458100 [Arabis alpina]